MNDNRNMILAHEQLDRTQLLNTMMYLRTTIEQKNTYVTTLEAELADMTAQRDAWRKTACASAIAPERLKMVELTAEQAVVLERIISNRGATQTQVGYFPALEQMKYAHKSLYHDAKKGHFWTITDTGRAALAAYRASHESEGE